MISITSKICLGFIRRPIVLTQTIVSLTAKDNDNSSPKSVSELRKEYSKQGIVESKELVTNGPFVLFKSWFDEACLANILEPNAMCLSTCRNNRPSSRYVLLKDFDEQGFVWFTNYNSKKGSDLEENPFAALTFWWGELERSIRIEGQVEKVSAQESDKYFHSRPRDSQLGAVASNQSGIISDREALEAQKIAVTKKYGGVEVIPRPNHWGGYRLIPDRIEFWKGRESRLHDRIVFKRSNIQSSWTIERLQP
eukprot:gene12254-16431_t